jgi:SAM-dependent methyltransferase
MSQAGGATPSTAVEREREYYDSGATERGMAAVARRLIQRSIGEFNSFQDLFGLFDPAGLDVLDYGCGRGYITLRLAQAGAKHVTALDLSALEVGHAEERINEAGLADRVTFVVGDAHQTPFPDGSFDLVVGAAILHHLDFERALRELHRLLRPGGEAVFIEPLALNPLLRLGRALSPGARTADEHPLTPEDWNLCAELFERFSHTERELLTIPLMPLNLVLPRKGQAWLGRNVKRGDTRVFRKFPRTRPYARVTFLRLGR